MGADGEQQELRKQVKDLQRQLAEALRERDDLTRDLEAMCLSDTGTTFNSSSVLQERIFAAGALRLLWQRGGCCRRGRRCMAGHAAAAAAASWC